MIGLIHRRYRPRAVGTSADFAAARLRRPAASHSRTRRTQVGRALFRHQHVPQLAQRIPVLQHAAPRRQGQQALFGKTVAGGGEHALGVRRRRHRGVEAADLGRRPGVPRGCRRAAARSPAGRAARGAAAAGRHAGPTSRAGARGAGQALERPPAFGAERETFGIDGRVLAAAMRQRGAEQVRAVGQAPARVARASRSGPGLRWRPVRTARCPRLPARRWPAFPIGMPCRSADRQKCRGAAAGTVVLLES